MGIWKFNIIYIQCIRHELLLQLIA